MFISTSREYFNSTLQRKWHRVKRIVCHTVTSFIYTMAYNNITLHEIEPLRYTWSYSYTLAVIMLTLKKVVCKFAIIMTS